MSMTEKNTRFDLPPNVHGKERGKLKLRIWDISPTSPAFSSKASSLSRSSSVGSKGSKNHLSVVGSGGVSLKIIWWGQSFESSACVSYIQSQRPNKAPVDNSCIEYSIRTRANLFQSYLSNCEPVEIKLTSNVSNLQIGTAFMRISKNFIAACPYGSAEETQVVNIFSPRNVALGEIKISLSLIFPMDKETSSLEYNALHFTGVQNDMNVSSLGSTRSSKSLKFDIYTCISLMRQKYVRSATTDSTNTLSSRAMDYLTGREMSEQDKKKALEEIQSTSPLESLVAGLTARLNIPVSDIYGRIDSLRLTVKSILIVPAGLREIELQHLEDVSFIVESHISPNLLTNISAKYDYDVLRFYSENIDSKDKRVDFNREAIRSIRITEYVDNAYIRFTIWSRPFGSKYSRCFGTAKYLFASLFENGILEEMEKLTIKSCTDKTIVGYLIVKVTLGSKGVHFGEDFMTTVEHTKLDKAPRLCRSSLKTCRSRGTSSIGCERILDSCRHYKETNKPNSSNPGRGSRSTEGSCKDLNKSWILTKSQSGRENRSVFQLEKDEDNKLATSTDEMDNSESQRFLQGLLYVGSIRNVRELHQGGYFLMCRAFWKEDATSTDFCQNYVFNFLEIFPVIHSTAFLERTRNNHLDLELWQKFADTPEQLVGVVKLPLHQFFIAFRDNAIASHICQAKLPVIATDGWVNICSPLSAESCGQLQALLAIGTEEQLEYLKVSRGLCLNRLCDRSLDNLAYKIPVPQIIPLPKPSDRSLSSCDAESQTNLPMNKSELVDSTARRERLSDLLGNFIDSLTQHLPTNQAQTAGTSVQSDTLCENKKLEPAPIVISQVRRTSDLLDVLQKALVTPPNLDGLTQTNLPSSLFKAPPALKSVGTQFVNILIEIENALHLPRNPSKLGSKKLLKRNNSASNKYKQSRLPIDEEPSAYVTFQAEEGSGQMVKSHEGMVYATNVVEKSCNPVWNRRFEVYVPADLLKNNEKRFIVKIWRKRVTDLAQCRLLPTPLEDAILGFATVDLNVLLAGLPCIAGWFNIVDFNGRINGQIKVNVRPQEDLTKFKPLPALSLQPTIGDSNIVSTDLLNGIVQPKLAPVMNNSTLSRAIKRKFTELEEITERLRARLLDVTGAPEALVALNTNDLTEQNPVDEQFDEFERDLNTECDEDSNGEKLDNFQWLGLSTNLQSACSSQDGSGFSVNDSSQERIQMISECLRRTELSPEEDNIIEVSQKERNPPEGETASSSDKKHLD